MEEAASDPLDISKEVDLVKDAQKDLSKVDVLICGGCHEVSHFVEEFQKHKENCTNVSILKLENEEKSQIWGFTLWKTKQVRTHRSKGEEVPTSWEIYQKWTKLEQHEKDMWITAGKTLQFINKISTSRVKEVKDDKKVEKDPLAIDDEVSSNEVSSNDLVKSGILRTVTVIQGSKKALRTSKDNEKEEYNVEKIMGKRFNPRKRYWEYEVKWENYAEPTWEPLPHLENCKALVQDFEAKLKAEKELKEKEKTPGRGRGRPRLNPNSPTPVKIAQKKPAMPPTPALFIPTTPGGRPQRTSKQKALNQVKAWCGNMSDEEGGTGMKRSYDDDDESDDSFEKKMKLEGESEDTEEDEPKPIVRKVAKIVHTYNNGVGKTSAATKLPDNVLIPDAKGVVRISQKQLPSLSSGVYIMSKSSGIIKLDPAASKIATSGGQAIVKVSPKIGQTQIKIIKKDDGSKRVVQVKGPEMLPVPALVATKPKVVQQVVNRPPIVKKDVEKTPKKVETPKAPPPRVVEKKEEVKSRVEEDSDDGIPDWEFPTDLPVPEPDSPPSDFILDPFTGKVAGIEYPDPEPEPVINEEKKEEAPSQSLENIVKLAAAEITEDDLKVDETTPTTSTTNENTPTTNTSTSSVNDAMTTTTTATVATTTPTIVATTNEPKTNQSILTTAIANSNILQKTLQSPNPRPKTQPRIINQAVARPRTSMTPLVRSVRPKTSSSLPPKPKFNIATPTTPKANNVVKKVNNTNTNVYKTKPPQTPSVKKPSPQKVAPPPSLPKAVISMPSLDEEPAVAEPDLSTFTLAPTERPMFITGDDGTVYQVAGQNEEGQTILLTQDSDGQQQCLLVTSDALQEEMDQVAENPAEVLMEVQEPVEVSEEQALVAQFIRTEPPSPGGTHKVVVMLPDGDMMVTQVTPEEYASLELDK